mmetsp:Transcript_36887/g.82035  ORF Transcript_36887/g.82035 Transcript_36887/m.82035 type:complete len:274 (+) Transcript_36887:119-940(+)|eukprot:CAMPEP_0202895730 /NCGR_PEP_ID=MMETSP1392-20130828/4886_1 /ASSEMBLY_ACC=CAM_ASM_000868 /TAXON_ID=225041 /ORGANISM="Chlamydomonas chlamydogama, Strain SAG 11-48b" /LENGTH=273 /DNA_ID=CAMNT_0049580853 /DNA_START=119 /DNA_END=940 /DNA_ORIENTATION=-
MIIENTAAVAGFSGRALPSLVAPRAWSQQPRSHPATSRPTPFRSAIPLSFGSTKRNSPRVVKAVGDDPYEQLFKSNVFKSDLVIQEFNSVVSELMGLSRMASKFPDFDLEGKKMFLDKMEEASSRYEVFIKRLELSDDPGAKEYLRITNAQMLEGGFTLQAMFMGLKQSLDGYRVYVQQEERASADPVTHARFKEAFKGMWAQSALGRIDMNRMSATDINILNRAQKDPNFWRAIKEISDSPSPEVMRKWLDDPAIGPLVAEMWKGMMGNKGM